MSEPKIYKPSVYNGNGVYNNGATGDGLGPYGVDWASGGWSAKNMFRRPNQSVSNGGTHDWYDVPGFGFAAPYYTDRKTTPAVYPQVWTDFKREDEHEVKISFLTKVSYPSDVILCGCINEDYNTIFSLEFRYGKDDAFFIIPSNGTWGSQLINVIGVSQFFEPEKKITCYLKHYANTDKFYMAFLVDDKIKLENEITLNDVKYYSDFRSFRLGGIKELSANAVQRNFWILYESFYKINGDFLALSVNHRNDMSYNLNVLDWT